MAYLRYGYVCHRKGIKTKRPVSKIHSRLNYASYFYTLHCIWAINYFVSIGITFEILTLVVNLFRRHLVMTLENTRVSKHNLFIDNNIFHS